MANPPPSSFLNPGGLFSGAVAGVTGIVNPVRSAETAASWIFGGAEIVAKAPEKIFKGTVDTTAEGSAKATRPMAEASRDIVADIGDFWKGVGSGLEKAGNQALIGEAILVGGAVAIVGITAWFFSRSAESRSGLTSGVKSLAKMLATGGAVR